MTFASVVDSSATDEFWQRSVLAVEPVHGVQKIRRVSSRFKVAVAETVAASAVSSSSQYVVSNKLASEAKGDAATGCGESIARSFSKEHLWQHWTSVRRQPSGQTEFSLSLDGGRVSSDENMVATFVCPVILHASLPPPQAGTIT